MKLFRKKEKPLKERSKRNRIKRPWVFWGILVSLAGAFLLSLFYGNLTDRAKQWRSSMLEQTGNVQWLYQTTYLLYKDLYNVQHESQLDYTDIYLKPGEGYEWMLDEEELERRAKSAYDEPDEPEEPTGEASDTLREPDYYALRDIRQEINNFRAYFVNLEGEFTTLNNIYDYVILDNVTGKYVTNMSDEEAEKALFAEEYNRYFFLAFQFDSAGNVSVGKVLSENSQRLRKAANEVIWENVINSVFSTMLETYKSFGEIAPPKSCTVIFAASADSLSGIKGVWQSGYYNGQISFQYDTDYDFDTDGLSVEAYRSAGLNGIIVISMLILTALGLFLPVLRGTKPWNDSRICSLPPEAVLILGSLFFAAGSLIESHIVFVAGGSAESWFSDYFQASAQQAGELAGIYNLAVLTLFFFCFWYLGICARALIDKGIRSYVKEKSLIYRIFPFLKGKVTEVYDALAHLDLTKDAHKTIIRLIVINGIILFVISLFWVGGFLVTIVYSAVLYLILRKYVSDLQKKYGVLLKAINEMAEGNLNVAINEDLGVFEPLKPQILKIQNGFRRAVDEEVKSQKMKAELITNVSHDLKTPLTAIITYVNLLKEESITEEQRREYLDVLERKSLRLKVLIEDLFEVSKANSQNISLNLTEVDIMSLLKQVSFEMSDKWEEAGLDIRMNLTDEKILLTLDSQKTYRIYENLFGNIAKYALQGTRVYVNGFRIDDAVVITLKNISAQEITVDSEDLTERFVRGDASRNTEGSGLGLAIAKSFTELQGGRLSLEVDGDLFKVTTTWRAGGAEQKA